MGDRDFRMKKKCRRIAGSFDDLDESSDRTLTFRVVGGPLDDMLMPWSETSTLADSQSIVIRMLTRRRLNFVAPVLAFGLQQAIHAPHSDALLQEREL